MQLVSQASYLCFLYLALCEMYEFGQPFAKSRLQGFPFACRSFLHLVLYLWITLVELQLLNTENNPLLNPFLFKYGERTVCYFDTSLLQNFFIRRDVVNIFKIEAGGVHWQKGEKRTVGLFIFFL